MTGAGQPAAPPVAEVAIVVADDLIWATRLADQVRACGLTALRCASLAALDRALASSGARWAIVDMTARAYDGSAAIGRASAAGLRVLAVGQHDDRAMRVAARAAGAERVQAYRTLFEHGHATVATWLGDAAPAPRPGAPVPSAGPTEAPPA